MEKSASIDKKCDENREDHKEIWLKFDNICDKLDTKVSMKLFLVLCAIIVSGVGVQVKTLQAMSDMAVSMAKVETTMTIHFGDKNPNGK
jgi:hypothetical protein